MDIPEILASIAHKYPVDLIASQLADISRISFNINLVARHIGRPVREVSLADLGGGIGLFSPGCAAAGFRRVMLIDDFSDSINHRVGDSVLEVHRAQGVSIASRDVITQGISDLLPDIDVVTSFDSMEHWHHSPRTLFRSVVNNLNPNGLFILGVPNCVNLRKRITVPFGFGKWSAMSEWYDADVFRGHVREPDVTDLIYIARGLGLEVVGVYGRNWQGRHSSRAIVRAATMLSDYLLRPFPTLCSDIYLVARKGPRESPISGVPPR